jgi:hypothetical protein
MKTLQSLTLALSSRASGHHTGLSPRTAAAQKPGAGEMTLQAREHWDSLFDTLVGIGEELSGLPALPCPRWDCYGKRQWPCDGAVRLACEFASAASFAT